MTVQELIDPQEAFIDNVARAITLLENLKAYFDDHMMVGPDEVNWGHVRTAGKVCEDLETIHQFVGLPTNFAD